MIRPNKVFIFFLAIIFFISGNAAGYAYVLASEYLCELGIQYYQQGKLADAIQEFNKALIANPDNETAKKYIDLIRGEASLTVTSPPIFVKPPVEQIPAKKIHKAKILSPKTRSRLISEVLDKFESGVSEIPPQQVVLPEILTLDDTLKTLQFPLEIEQRQNIIIRGRNIARFLSTQLDILNIERNSPNEIVVTGNKFGYTDLYIWDDQGRSALEFLSKPAKPKFPTLAEQMLYEEEKAQTFKLRYYLDWSSREQGRRIDSLKRLSYGYTHGLSIYGQTPYGDLNSSLTVRSLNTTTDLTYLALSLTEGSLGKFKGFSLNAFDFAPEFTNLISSNIGLRGVSFESPAFEKKLDYSIFWGREGGGRFGNLSPGLIKIKDSFLSGFNLDLSPWKAQHYNFTVMKGWGRDRPADLHTYGYDLDAGYHFDKLDLNYEIANDSETFAHLFNLAYSLPRLRLTTELRDTDKHFKTMTGWGWRAGELGSLSTLYYTPSEKLSISSRLDVFQDRLFPNPKNDDRWNEDFNFNTVYTFNRSASLRLDYDLQNELGKISEYRSQSAGIGLNKAFDWIKRINTYLNYRHRESKNFTSHTSDFINDKLVLGLRFSLIGEIYYYLNKEYNWLEETLTRVTTQPEAMETGVDWIGRISDTPFYGNFRCIYREEKNTASPLSFLSGEDYLEGYAELSFRPDPDKELYCSTRVRNVWAGENLNVNKRVEADFRAGMRCLWDTGLRWEAIGAVEGYVFKDYNGDSLRQRDEPPVAGIKIWLGKDKTQVTDIFGYYNFKKIKARKAYVALDTSTMPSGYILTSPVTQDIAVAQGQAIEINFGIVSRSEITGIVFEDVNLDKKLSNKDKPVKGVVLLLEDGTKAITDDAGRYFFRKAAIGRHTVTLDMNSLPTKYLPTVPIFKDLELSEGVSFSYDVPLKKVEE